MSHRVSTDSSTKRVEGRKKHAKGRRTRPKRPVITDFTRRWGTGRGVDSCFELCYLVGCMRAFAEAHAPLRDPGIGFSEEYKNSLVEGLSCLQTDSRFGRMSCREYYAFMDDVQRMRDLYRQGGSTKEIAARIVGDYALNGSNYGFVFSAYEEFFHCNPEKAAIGMAKPARRSALVVRDEFVRLAGNRTWLVSPFWALCNQTQETSPDVLDMAEELSCEVWNMASCAPTIELVGTLLLEEDCGFRHMNMLSNLQDLIAMKSSLL